MGSFHDQVRMARLLPEIAKTIDKMIADADLPKQPWSLYTWGGNRCQYISNTDRQQTRAAMKETLARWDEQQDPPMHKFD